MERTKRAHRPRILRRLLPLVLLAAGCHSAPTDGWSAYQRGDYATALATWKPAAESGDADAQFLVGVIFDEGQGVPPSRTEAAKWYRRAAEQGHAPAQTNLGVLCYRGEGVPQSFTEAARWYERAAIQGFAAARNNLGVMYLFGQAVPRDKEVARALLEVAAAQGDPKAKSILCLVFPNDRADQSARNRAESIAAADQGTTER